MTERNTENEIEFIDGDKTCTVSFTARKFVNKIKRLHEKESSSFGRFVENPDGSVYARIPLSWIKINPPRKMSDDQKRQAADRLRQRMNNESQGN